MGRFPRQLELSSLKVQCDNMTLLYSVFSFIQKIFTATLDGKNPLSKPVHDMIILYSMSINLKSLANNTLDDTCLYSVYKGYFTACLFFF